MTACLPVMEVDSLLTGRRGVSLSFSDYCEALVQDEEDFKLLYQTILEFGRMSRWRYVEFRGEQFLSTERPVAAYAHHVINLSKDEDAIRSRLRDSTVRNIRKAVKEGVSVTISQSLQSVRDFFSLHCLTRKRHGVPPQPRSFFDKLHEHVISQGHGFTALAIKDGVPVAAVICLHFGNNAVYKYGASDAEFQHLRANNLVMWESIIKCARDGYGSFSLGRTDLNNEGLLSFKNGWGGSKTVLNYYRYDFGSSSFIDDPGRDLEIYKYLLKKIPVKMLTLLGKFAYRHMG